MKRALIMSWTLLLILPLVAAAAEAPVTPPEVPADVELEATGLCEAPVVEPEAAGDVVFLQGAQGPNCCFARQRRCEGQCHRTGVFEFSCDPATCQSSCLCNIGP